MGGSGSKKKSPNNEEETNDKKDARWSVTERKHPYEECHPENEDETPDPEAVEQYKAPRQPRPYEDVDKDFDQEKSEAKDSSNSRLSQKSGELNYVDVEFTKPKKKKASKKNKDSDSSDVPPPSVEYSEVIIENSKPNLK